MDTIEFEEAGAVCGDVGTGVRVQPTHGPCENNNFDNIMSSLNLKKKCFLILFSFSSPYSQILELILLLISYSQLFFSVLWWSSLVFCGARFYIF